MAFALLVVIVVIAGFLVEKPAFGDLDPKACSQQSQVFTSRSERVRIVVPRGWCATDHPSYPGLLVSMLHTDPPSQIMLTSEPFTRELYCSWPVNCRNQPTSTARYACAIRDKLTAGRMKVGPSQLGPKENEAAGLPSVWFEYDDGKRFLRQAITVNNDRALSLVLSTPTNEARAAHVRPFDQALRTLQMLTAAEIAAPVGAVDAGVIELDGGAGSAADGGGVPLDGGVTSDPVVKQSPIGPCPR